MKEDLLVWIVEKIFIPFMVIMGLCLILSIPFIIYNEWQDDAHCITQKRQWVERHVAFPPRTERVRDWVCVEWDNK